MAGSCAQRLGKEERRVEKRKRKGRKDQCSYIGQLLQRTIIILVVKQNSAKMVFMASLSVSNSSILVIQGELVAIFFVAWRGCCLIWINVELKKIKIISSFAFALRILFFFFPLLKIPVS